MHFKYFFSGLFLLLAIFLLLSCDQTVPNDVDGNTAELPGSNEVPGINLITKSFDEGHYTVLVPEGYKDYITKEVLGKDSLPTIKTYKYRSSTDSMSAVGISHGLKDDASARHIPKFLQKLEDEARRFKVLRTISSETRLVNGREFGILKYSLWRDGQEVDYSVVAAGIYENNVLTLNILFSGPVQPGYDDLADKIVKSLEVNEHRN